MEKIYREKRVKRVATKNTEPSKTDQQYKQDCDVNHIIRKFSKTGQISHLAKAQGQYADVAEIPDLLGALGQVTQAQQSFDLLPAELRKKFSNSPVEMYNWLQNPQNDKEAVRLGLKEVRNAPSQASTSVPTREETKRSAVGKNPQLRKNQKQNQSQNDDDSNDDE